MDENSTITPRRQILCAALVAVAGYSAAKAIQAGEDLVGTVRTEPDPGSHNHRSDQDPIVDMHREAAASLSSLDADDSDGDAAFGQLAALREAAFGLRPAGLPGALASLEWARMEFAAGYIAPRIDRDAPDRLDRLTLHLIDGAIGALRQAAELRAA